MLRVGRPLVRNANGGRSTNGAGRIRPRAATATTVAALVALLLIAVGCETVGTPAADSKLAASQARASARAGLDLYESREYDLAARRFHESAIQAERARDRALQKKVVMAECTAWLRSRQLVELSECTEQLERLQRREGRSDPGVNTLIALGAIAGQRPLPPLRIPNPVQTLVRQAAAESPR